MFNIRKKTKTPFSTLRIYIKINNKITSLRLYLNCFILLFFLYWTNITSVCYTYIYIYWKKKRNVPFGKIFSWDTHAILFCAEKKFSIEMAPKYVDTHVSQKTRFHTFTINSHTLFFLDQSTLQITDKLAYTGWSRTYIMVGVYLKLNTCLFSRIADIENEKVSSQEIHMYIHTYRNSFLVLSRCRVTIYVHT